MDAFQKNSALGEISELQNMHFRCSSEFLETVKSCDKWVPLLIEKLESEGQFNERNEVRDNLLEMKSYI